MNTAWPHRPSQMVMVAMTHERVTVRAPAKINLYLHVTGKRPDGFHELDSLVVFTASGDTVRVSPAASGAGLHFTASGPFADRIGPDADNLVVRAARLMAETVDPASLDVDIHLTKRLPVAAGIGGGSSDAAATLRALNRYWEAGLDDAQLATLGLQLGADVPMCLYRNPVFVGGIGEAITKAPALPLLSLVLVNPGIGLATPDVFKAYADGHDGKFSAAQRFADEPGSPGALAELLKKRGNDLSPAALSLAPVIGEMLSELGRQPGCLLARMSGSGATCFGLFADSAEAEAARHTIQLNHDAWWCDAMMLF